ncbi:MAG TPA: tetratricopeptide repeat protein [Pyrinomonadaceae bacterium]
MNLQSQRKTSIADGFGSDVVKRASEICRHARELEKAGEYEGAAEALSAFWDPSTNALNIDQLDDATQAEVLLRVGCVVGWQGSVDQEHGTQETAKDFISRSIRLYEDLGEQRKTAEARADLGLCYWREGAFDEARINFAQALSELPKDEPDLRALILIRAGIVEVDARRLSEALRIYGEAADVVAQSSDHNLQGTFHNEFGLALRRMADLNNLEAYLDRALIEYSAASFHFERAGNTRYVARVENNLGFLFYTIGRHDDAHRHLDRARQLFIQLKDTGTVAQVDETRARTFLASGRFADAERVIRAAVRVLERGDEKAILAEAITTYGTVKARLGKFVRARQLLDRAIETAETCGDLEGAGRAKLSIIEELTAQTTPLELAATYEAAVDLLKNSQEPTTTSRLVSVARIVIGALGESGDDPQPVIAESWDNFSIKREVRAFEKSLIERALRDSGGAVTKAAHLLGFKHHQSLISLINSRHRDLLVQRSAVRPRRSHLFSKPRRAKQKLAAANSMRTPAHIRILHVEDEPQVSDAARGAMSGEKWEVELCPDGDSALRKLTGNEHYDVVIVDSSLSGVTGLELAQRTRKITHRRRTPILMLSGDDLETEARSAGVDAFLKKSDQLTELTPTVARLLREGSRNR